MNLFLRTSHAGMLMLDYCVHTGMSLMASVQIEVNFVKFCSNETYP